MILKKPYGFLIKHFKIIHLFLTGLYIYLLIKVNSLLRYYNGYLAGTENKLNAIKLVTNYYLIAVFFSVIICIIIYALMRYKKKPKLLYVILIILYIITATIINISYGGLQQIYIYNTLDLKTLRLYRDILRILTVFQYISIGFTLIRGLGFDIKKFNFKDDIADLDLNIDDQEEIELTLGSNEGLFRRIRKKIREYTYYYKENKLIIITLVAIFTVIILLSLLLNKKVINKVYNENENINTELFTFNITNTYITNRNYNNKLLNNSDSTYLIVKIFVSPYYKDNTINTGNFVLQINNNKYAVEQSNNNNFKDIGVLYIDQKIKGNNSYILVFKIPSNNANKKMLLTYTDKIKINISPKNIDEEEKAKEAKINDKISFEDSILNRGSLKVTGLDIKDNFSYSFNYEVDGKSYSSKLSIKSYSNTILNLKTNIYLPNKISSYDFLNTYGKIKYIVNNNEYTSNIMNNKTPGNYQEGLFLEVDKNIENATKIWLEIKIRNKVYIYHLK